MKFNKISMVLAALAFVGCSSEDLNEFSATPAVEDSNLIQLGSDFVLAGVGAEGTTTRTHWEMSGKSLVNKFLPIWAANPTTGTIADFANLQAQAVGLCWLGNGATGTDVYTNYEFYHFGWLNKGQDKATFECNQLMNGSLYSEITAATGTAGAEAIPGTDWTASDIPTKSQTTAGADNLNYNSGIYKTDNKAIFGGQYIVYYPYNEDFKDAGTIPAAAITEFGDATMGTDAPTALTSPELGSATFRYSAPVTIEGGKQAADFGLKNLSALVQLRVAAAKGYSGSTKFDKIVLYSEKKQLLKQANLAADKIAAGNEGTDLYTETEGTKTVVANLPSGLNLTATNGSVTSAYITALPTTVEDLVVFVHSNNLKKWAKVSLPNTEFKAGSAKRLDITVADADFKADFIAVDQASLQQALTDAEASAAATAPQTIQVIGDITLSSNLWITNSADAFITIKGDDIIVPENRYLGLSTIMESNVRVLGKSCCSGTQGGRLYVYGGTISNVTLEKTEAKVNSQTDYDNYNPELGYYGAATATVAAGKTVDVQAGNVIVNQAVQHKGDIKIAKDVKLTVNTGGDLNFMGSNVTNNGTIEVEKGGKYDMTDANGNATATDGQRMTNNGKFIHNVDAGVGTAVQSMKQNGEYRCRVDEQIKLDDAFLQWTACSVIEIVDHASTAQNYNLGTAEGLTDKYKHNGKFIDIEVNTPSNGVTTFISPANDAKQIQVGNLTVTAGGLNVNYAYDAAKKTQRTLTVNGDMTVAANTTLTESKKISVTGNLIVEGAGVTLTYKGAKANKEGLAVTKDIKVSGATFDAGSLAADVNALDITCANFYLEKGATATFGNRTDGAAKNLVVNGTISNPAGCTFNIVAANQDGAGSVLAWVTCTKLEVGGTFSAARPRVVAAE